MSKFSSAFEESVFRALEEVFISNENRLNFSLVLNKDLRFYGSNTYWKPDFVVLSGETPLMIIEVANREFDRRFVDSSIVVITDNLYDINYFVEVSKYSAFLYNFITKESSLVDFVRFLEFLKADFLRPNVPNGVINEIIEVINQELERFYETSQVPGNRRFSASIENIEFNDRGRFFSFKPSAFSLEQSFESLFFKSLLEPIDENNVCRYTTLDSIFFTIDTLKYRMGSSIAMNDRGEIDYVDKYLKLGYLPLEQMTPHDLMDLNRSFITSCTLSTQKDDLTMFRLYGDNSRGVCLCFEISEMKFPGFFLGKVSYAQSKNEHAELEVLKNIVEAVERLKYRFRFLELNIWRNFFKSYDYRVEQEVRLLFIQDSESSAKPQWFISRPDGIVAQFVMLEFDSCHFPLKLTSIILGPNTPEVVLNRKQLDLLLTEKGIKNTEVTLSLIDSYRSK